MARKAKGGGGDGGIQVPLYLNKESFVNELKGLPQELNTLIKYISGSIETVNLRFKLNTVGVTDKKTLQDEMRRSLKDKTDILEAGLETITKIAPNTKFQLKAEFDAKQAKQDLLDFDKNIEKTTSTVDKFSEKLKALMRLPELDLNIGKAKNELKSLSSDLKKISGELEQVNQKRIGLADNLRKYRHIKVDGEGRVEDGSIGKQADSYTKRLLRRESKNEELVNRRDKLQEDLNSIQTQKSNRKQIYDRQLAEENSKWNQNISHFEKIILQQERELESKKAVSSRFHSPQLDAEIKKLEEEIKNNKQLLSGARQKLDSINKELTASFNQDVQKLNKQEQDTQNELKKTLALIKRNDTLISKIKQKQSDFGNSVQAYKNSRDEEKKLLQRQTEVSGKEDSKRAEVESLEVERKRLLNQKPDVNKNFQLSVEDIRRSMLYAPNAFVNEITRSLEEKLKALNGAVGDKRNELLRGIANDRYTLAKAGLYNQQSMPVGSVFSNATQGAVAQSAAAIRENGKKAFDSIRESVIALNQMIEQGFSKAIEQTKNFANAVSHIKFADLPNINDVYKHVKNAFDPIKNLWQNDIRGIIDSTQSLPTALDKAFELIGNSPSIAKATEGLTGFKKGLAGAFAVASTGLRVFAGIGVTLWGFEKSLENMARPALEAQNALYIMSLGMHSSIDDMKQLSVITQVAGVNMNSVQTALRRVNAQLVKTSEGSKLARETLKHYGANLFDERGNLKQGMAQLDEIAKAYQNAMALGKGAEFRYRVGGRYWDNDFVALISDYAANKKAMNEIVKSNLADPALAYSVRGSMYALEAQQKQLQTSFASAFMPVVEHVAPQMKQRFAELTKIIEQNAPAIKSLGFAIGEIVGKISDYGTSFIEKASRFIRWLDLGHDERIAAEALKRNSDAIQKLVDKNLGLEIDEHGDFKKTKDGKIIANSIVDRISSNKGLQQMEDVYKIYQDLDKDAIALYRQYGSSALILKRQENLLKSKAAQEAISNRIKYSGNWNAKEYEEAMQDYKAPDFGLNRIEEELQRIEDIVLDYNGDFFKDADKFADYMDALGNIDILKRDDRIAAEILNPKLEQIFTNGIDTQQLHDELYEIASKAIVQEFKESGGDKRRQAEEFKTLQEYELAKELYLLRESLINNGLDDQWNQYYDTLSDSDKRNIASYGQNRSLVDSQIKSFKSSTREMLDEINKLFKKIVDSWVTKSSSRSTEVSNLNDSEKNEKTQAYNEDLDELEKKQDKRAEEIKKLQFDVEFGNYSIARSYAEINRQYQKELDLITKAREANKLEADETARNAKDEELDKLEKTLHEQHEEQLKPVDKQFDQEIVQSYKNAYDTIYRLSRSTTEQELRNNRIWLAEEQKKIALLGDEGKKKEALLAKTTEFAAKEMESMKKLKDELKGNLRSMEEEYFKLTHSQFEGERLNIMNEYKERVKKNPADEPMARRIAELKLAKLLKENQDNEQYFANPKYLPEDNSNGIRIEYGYGDEDFIDDVMKIFPNPNQTARASQREPRYWTPLQAPVRLYDTSPSSSLQFEDPEEFKNFLQNQESILKEQLDRLNSEIEENASNGIDTSSLEKQAQDAEKELSRIQQSLNDIPQFIKEVEEYKNSFQLVPQDDDVGQRDIEIDYADGREISNINPADEIEQRINDKLFDKAYAEATMQGQNQTAQEEQTELDKFAEVWSVAVTKSIDQSYQNVATAISDSKDILEGILKALQGNPQESKPQELMQELKQELKQKDDSFKLSKDNVEDLAFGAKMTSGILAVLALGATAAGSGGFAIPALAALAPYVGPMTAGSIGLGMVGDIAEKHADSMKEPSRLQQMPPPTQQSTPTDGSLISVAQDIKRDLEYYLPLIAGDTKPKEEVDGIVGFSNIDIKLSSLKESFETAVTNIESKIVELIQKFGDTANTILGKLKQDINVEIGAPNINLSLNGSYILTQEIVNKMQNDITTEVANAIKDAVTQGINNSSLINSTSNG